MSCGKTNFTGLKSWRLQKLTPLIYEDPPILPNPVNSYFVNTSPYFPLTPNLTPAPLVFLLSCFYFCCPVCCLFAILLNDNMDLHILSLGTLVSEGPWCVFYVTRCQVYGGLTHNMFFTGTLIWYHPHTNTHSTLKGQ